MYILVLSLMLSTVIEVAFIDGGLREEKRKFSLKATEGANGCNLH